MGDFVEMGNHTVYFATGDYSISADDRQALTDLAKQAAAYQKGYVIQVAAFADSVGAAADNQVLSKERAQAVVAYLLQECNIPVGRIVTPGAMGETNPVDSNETASGRSENRRAEVKLLGTRASWVAAETNSPSLSHLNGGADCAPLFHSTGKLQRGVTEKVCQGKSKVARYARRFGFI